METDIRNTVKDCLEEGLRRMVLSNAPKSSELLKVKVYPVVLKGVTCYQVEEYRGTQVFHSNCDEEEVLNRTVSYLTEGAFRQAEMVSTFFQYTMLFGKKGTVTVKKKKAEGASVVLPAKEHNRQKNYLLPEGVAVPFLVDLGVMTKEGAVVKARYDKFRQINRFLEFVQDILPELPTGREVRILDFGCGKSYLTFALYYYLHCVKQYPVRITGLDLKKTVIEDCNRLAKSYGYDALEFLCGDIADYTGTDAVDMVVTLHACDTATDYALYKALRWNASVILSVPCCQHEWNRQMENEQLDFFTKYGIIKERMSALMTDAFRANVLEACGYKTQILEFIDMEHTPKNLLLRAVKSRNMTQKEQKDSLVSKVGPELSLYGVEPTLYRLLHDME